MPEIVEYFYPKKVNPKQYPISVCYRFKRNNEIYEIDKEINGIIVEIYGEEYEKCVEMSLNMWCSSKDGEWGRGLANTKNDPKKVERTGRLGEVSVAKITELPVNSSYIKNGDSGDLVLRGSKKTINVKTSICRPDYDCGLVKAKDNEVFLELKEDYYVFCFVLNENIEKKTASVVIVGFMNKEKVKNNDYFRLGKKGTHCNWQIPYADMRPLIELFTEISPS